jgi:hypothetical protein
MFSSLTNKNVNTQNIVKWGGYSFNSHSLNSIYFSKLNTFGIFILTKKDEDGNWVPYFIEEMPYTKLAIFDEARLHGITHIHISQPKLNDKTTVTNYLILKESLIEKYNPELNRTPVTIDSGESDMTDETETPDALVETKSKLELLYKYQAHYLELIKLYKEEIKFASTLQEDLRRERSQFFTQTLKDVVTTMQQAEVDKDVSNKWLEELVSSYTRSLDLSGDLAKTHVIEILSLLTNEAKTEASKASLDSINKK